MRLLRFSEPNGTLAHACVQAHTCTFVSACLNRCARAFFAAALPTNGNALIYGLVILMHVAHKHIRTQTRVRACIDNMCKYVGAHKFVDTAFTHNRHAGTACHMACATARPTIFSACVFCSVSECVCVCACFAFVHEWKCVSKIRFTDFPRNESVADEGGRSAASQRFTS